MKITQYSFVLALVCYCLSASAQVVYVNRAATGTNNGTSWTNAYTSLGAAMRATTVAGRQIWVAAGTYKPDTITGLPLRPGVQLYGGFAGTEANLGQRNVATNRTILSGDIGSNDVTGNFTTNRTDNAHHVIFLNGTDTISRAVIDGFEVRGGNTLATPPNTPTPPIAAVLAAHGGGVLAATPVTVRNCSFTDNAGANGAAITAVGGPASGALVRDCSFERNFTGERALVYYLNLRSGDIRRCNFQNNLTARGCFLANNSRGVVADSCLFTRNRTAGTLLCAGLYTLGSAANISNCIFRDNRSDAGAAGMWLNGGNAANTRVNSVSNCIFERDSTAGASGAFGGAMQITTSAIATLNNCIFRENFASTGGGAVVVASVSNATLTNCILEKNKVNSTGGAVRTQDQGTRFLAEGCTFTENSSVAFAGAIVTRSASSATLRNSVLNKNKSQAGGAATVADQGSVITFEDCKITENRATGTEFQDGGALWVPARGSAIMRRCTLEKNTAERLGGAITIQQDTSKLTIEDCVFSENAATGATADGGAIYSFEGPDINIQRTNFIGNTATELGGALLIRSSIADVTDINIQGTSFLGNTAMSNGGAISISGSRADVTGVRRMDRCIFRDNSSVTQGGALDVQNVPNLIITNSLFEQNSGDNGGAISNNASGQDTSRITMTYCTFVNNLGGAATCITQFEARDSSEAFMSFQNCIMGTHLSEIYVIEQGKPTVVSRGGNLCADASMKDYLKGTNDLNETDPKFADENNNNFRLAPTSPCINKGIAVAGITTDLLGIPRGTQPDMGCYEFVPVSVFDRPEALRIELSPNPVTDMARLRIDDENSGDVITEFFDITGKMIAQARSEKAAGEWQLLQPVANWANGMYQVRVRVGSVVYSGTLVK